MLISPSVRLRVGLGAGVITAILALCLAGGVPAALADGDPASDVLSNAVLFDPPDAQVPYALEARLTAVLAASARAGFPIRVALINSPYDLGTVTSLWGKSPGDYASYLWAELSDLFPGQILVVTPRGFGLHGPAKGSHAIAAAEAAVRAPSPTAGTGLAQAALTAVPLLAKADGHPIPASSIHVRAASYRAPGTPAAVWVVLPAGLLIVIAAWWASLRARPLALRRGAST